MNHTFLFTEGVWLAKGVYYDEQNNVIKAEGRVVISHQEQLWINEGVMSLMLDSPIELKNRYEIKPFQGDFTSWQSFNPALEKLIGKFMVVEDTIISTYTTENNDYSGSECVVKINDTLYIAKGFAFQGDTKLSSWSMELSKVE